MPYLTLSAPAEKTAAPDKKDNTAGKININTASLNQLKSNPHIPAEIAQAIVIYRSQHGNFAAIEEVKKIVFINEDMYTQIAPYYNSRIAESSLSKYFTKNSYICFVLIKLPLDLQTNIS